MENKNETVAEVIAAERDHIERAKADAEDLEIECEFTDEEVVCIIDRIEAAHRREMADFEATKTALANVIAEKKQFAEIAAKKEREVAELRKQTRKTCKRNCDRFKDAEEAEFYYRKEHNSAYAPAGDFIRWLFFPKSEGAAK